jgi:hypothetical protein
LRKNLCAGILQRKPLPFFSYEAKMTMKLTKASVGLSGILSLLACTSSGPGKENPGTAGGSAGSGSGTAGGSGTNGSGTAGSTAGTNGTSGNSGGSGTTGGSGTSGTSGQAGATAGSGGGGQSGTGGTGTAGTGPTDDSVLERGKRASRDGNYLQPTLTTASMMKVGMDMAFTTNATYTGDMYASPLYLAAGPGGKGIFIAATTNNDVKAFDDTGAMVWTKSFTNPTSGGSLAPRGIMGTPVIDATLGSDGFATIYACAPAAPTAGGKMDHYELHALSAKDGSERMGWPAKLDGTIKATNDGLSRAFNPVVEAQRPALSLVKGIVYIGFGGPFGDFAGYYGWVIAVDTKNPATIGAWSSRLGGAAVWTPGGFASDGDGVLVTTGNYWANMGGYSAPATYGDSEAIIRLSGGASALAKKDAYWPSRWRQMDQDDQDFGSSSVLLLNVPGATPPNYAVTVSKDSHLYFANTAMLGAATGGGEVLDMQLTTTPTNHSARTSPVSYMTASGLHIAVTVDRGPYTPAMCPATPAVDPNMAVLMGFTVTASPFKVTTDWCTNVGGPAMGDNGTVKNRSVSPLVTTTDGKANPIVWVGGSMSQMTAGTPANMMYAVDGETGAVLFKGGTCAGIRQWTTPIAVKGHIVIGGTGKLCSWSPQP